MNVVVPGGTGAVGEGVVRAYLAAGADVVVPTRSPQRAAEFRQVLGEAASDRLHLVVHDYTTFAGAAALAAETERRLGGVDHVVAPIGGWWAGKRLWEIDEADWQGARTRHVDAGDPDWVTADQVGEIARSVADLPDGREIRLLGQADVRQAATARSGSPRGR